MALKCEHLSAVHDVTPSARGCEDCLTGPSHEWAVRVGRCVSVSVVNGYICFSCCDEAKARAGKNPHPKAGQSEDARQPIGGVDDPAVTYGGSLAAAKSVAPVDADSSADAVNVRSTGTVLDILT